MICRVKTESKPPFLRNWRLALAPILAMVALCCWSLASPVGASPDDDYHLSSIWCAEGERAGVCEKNTDSTWDVPTDVRANSICYVFAPGDSANCQGEGFGEPPHELSETDRGNFEGQYPPVFYAAMGTIVSPDINSSVVSMRILNAAIFVALTTLVFIALPRRLRPALVMSVIVSAVPLAMFIIPSVNPSGWAYISAATLWISVLGYFETTGRRSLALGALAMTATIIGAGSRADAAVYAGVAVGAVLILKAEFTKRFLIKLLLPVTIGIVSIAFFLSANQTDALDGFGDDRKAIDTKRLLYDNLLNAPDLLAGMFGKWGLGWLDTVMPAAVWVAGIGIYFAITFFGLGRGGIRKVLAVTLVLAALWLMPTYILVQSQLSVGEGVQPRYMLPLIVLLAGIALLRPEGSPFALNRSQRFAVIAGLTAMNSVAMHVNLRRYVTGIDHGGWNLDAGAEWWWNIPIGPTALWIIGSLAFAGVIILIVQFASRPTIAIDTSGRPLTTRDESVPVTAAS